MKRAAIQHLGSNHEASPRLVICCGMIRSGSTLQYQLASAILGTAGPVQKLGFLAPGEKSPAYVDRKGEVGICKLHHWDESLASLLRTNRAVAFYCSRDLRDVAVSAMRKFDITFENLWQEKWISDAVTQGERWLALPNVYSSSYELIIEDLESEIRRMAQWIGIPIKPEEIASIAVAHSFKTQKLRAAKLATSAKITYDANSLLHPNHLDEGAVGGWRKILSKKQARVISEEFASWLEVRGYLPATTVSVLSAASISNKISQPTEVFVPHCGWFNHSGEDEVAQLLREGHYEADLQAFLWLYLKSGDRVVDVGSHFGLYARLASTLVGAEGRVFAVEPHPETQIHLASNLASSPQVTLVKAALGKKEGTARLAMGNTGYSAHSYLSAKSSGKSASVEVSTLAKLILTATWEEVSLVKIDTEGREFDVLEGAGALLGSSALPVITLEFSERNLLHFGRTTQQLARFLWQQGYTVCRFATDSLQLVPITNDIWPVWYENFIAVLDIDLINRRLDSASVDHRRIALDILARAEACQQIQALADLETYRKAAKQSVMFKEWAEAAETKLAAERKNARELETWALKTEKLLAAERQRAAEFEKWALKAEALAAKNAKLVEETKHWAETAEAKLAAERKNARELETWALKTEKLLAAERQRAAEFEKWALEAEALAAKNAKLVEETKLWAEAAEARVKAEQEIVRTHKAWAEQTEAFLAQARQELAKTKDRARQLERQSTESKQAK